MVLSNPIRRLRSPEIGLSRLKNRIRMHLPNAASLKSAAAGGQAVDANGRDLKSRIVQRLETFAESLSGLIQVDLDGDTAIVTGSLDSDDDRQLVIRIVSQVREVASIRDRLEVAYPGRSNAVVDEPEALWSWVLGCWGQRP